MKFIAVYRAGELTKAIFPNVSLKKAARGMICLSESHQGLNFRDAIWARRYCFGSLFGVNSALFSSEVIDFAMLPARSLSGG